jgi:hypothetical protein
MTDCHCTNKAKVNQLIRNEPYNFYNEIYKIFETDCNTFDLNSFKNFYIVRRLPLYNCTFEKEAFKIVESEINTNNKNISRIFKTIIEDTVGHGTIENFYNAKYLFYYDHFKLGKVITSPHVITNMSHIITAMNYGIDVKNYDLILEFGGGYGGMAKICNGMGYNNTYYIYDLPQLKKMQNYHLTEINVKHKIINEIKELKQSINIKGKKLFIATWSISEVNNELREQIIEIIKNFDSVFIIFQHNNPVGTKQDNYNYFYNDGLFQTNFNNIDNWYLEKMNFVHWDGGSYYLIGTRKQES